jgi:hypothetical protein
MHTTTLLHLLLASGAALTSATAIAREGPPKPKQEFTLDMMNTCGCDVPALVIRACQNIPTDAPIAEKKACICESQNKTFGPFWRHHMVCGPCAGPNAVGQEKLPELRDFMGVFNGVIGGIWNACYYGDCIGCPGERPTIDTTGDAVCANAMGNRYCAHIGEDAASGWASIEGPDEPNGFTNVSATFTEMKVENAVYAMKQVELPDSGYPKKKEEDKKEENKKEENKKEEDKKEEDKEDKTDAKSDSKNSTETTTDKKDDKSTDVDSEDSETKSDASEKPATKDGGESGATGLKGSGFAAAFGIAVALFML